VAWAFDENQLNKFKCLIEFCKGVPYKYRNYLQGHVEFMHKLFVKVAQRWTSPKAYNILPIIDHCEYMQSSWMMRFEKMETLEKSSNEMSKKKQRVNGMHWHKMHPNPSYHTQRWKNLCCWNLWNTSFHSFWAFENAVTDQPFMFQEVREQWRVVLTSQNDSWVHQNSRYEKGMVSWHLKQSRPKDIGTYSRNVYSDTNMKGKCIYKFSKWKFVCIFCLLFVPTHICLTCFLIAFKFYLLPHVMIITQLIRQV
jgi:hypothetical protein